MWVRASGLVLMGGALAACGSTSDAGLVGGAGAMASTGGQGAKPSGGSGGDGGSGGAPAAGGTSGSGATGGSTPVVVSCDSDNDCTPRGQLCDFVRGRCVDCLTDAQCDAPAVCAAGRCEVLVPCTDSRDCVGASDGRTICNAGMCVQCARTPDCNAGQECVDNRCSSSTTGCTAPTDCPAGFCDAATGQCVQCRTTDDCGPGEICEAGDCHVPGCTPLTDCAGRCGPVDDGCGATLYCPACPTGCASGEGLVLSELHFGGPDYIVVVNRSATCTHDLANVQLWAYIGIALGIPLIQQAAALSGTLGPGQSVVVTEAAGEQPGDIVVADFTFVSTYFTELRLCWGACTGVSTDPVLDFVVLIGQMTAPPPSFDTPLPSLTDEAATSYVRVAYAGAMPTFFASDWTAGPATRPDPATP